MATVSSFRSLVSTPFRGQVNALCWGRPLTGDCAEIVAQCPFEGHMAELHSEQLLALNLGPEGNAARQMLLSDLRLLTDHGAAPTLNLIRCYERDDHDAVFPTDVYSFHVDRAPVPTDTFLCTYHGACSEILNTREARQKVLIPEVRSELRRRYRGPEHGFADYLSERCYDLHYDPLPGARPVRMALGELWRLAVKYPHGTVAPCIHRAPEENGLIRLLLIC